MKKHYSNRKQRLAKYSAVAGSVIAASGVNAQIIYTDVNPDLTVTLNNAYPLDLNGSGADIDFMIGASPISASGFVGQAVGLTTAGSNGVIGTAGSLITYADTLNLYQAIDNTGAYYQAASSASSAIILGATGTFSGFPISTGPWLGINDKYLGLQFMIGANMHYGWARLSVAADASEFTIKDFAYESSPNTPTQAGLTGASGVNDINIAAMVGLRLTEEQLTINVINPDLTNGRVELIDLSGRTVKSNSLNGTLSMDVSGLTSGMYIIRVSFDQGQMAEKLFVR